MLDLAWQPKTLPIVKLETKSIIILLMRTIQGTTKF